MLDYKFGRQIPIYILNFFFSCIKLILTPKVFKKIKIKINFYGLKVKIYLVLTYETKD